MARFELEDGEQIILETDGVTWIREDDFPLEELALSNKNLYLVYKKKNGVFLKPTVEIIKRSLSDIVIRNDQVMVTQGHNGNGICLQVQFIQGREQFYFHNEAKKNITEWINEIYIILVGTTPPPKEKTRRFHDFLVSIGFAHDAEQEVSYTERHSGGFSANDVQGSEKSYQSRESNHNPEFSSRSESNIICPRCGEKIDPNAKFCPSCGAPVPKTDKQPETSSTQAGHSAKADEDYRSKRKQEYAGTVVKCPACGAELHSFTAICPVCGHEINSAKVSPAIQEFSKLINQADEAIANSPATPKNGWSSWNTWVKVVWVILNIYTLCIPLVIYFVLPLLGVGGISSFTSEEKKKAQLISNYAFPNDRENILEALMFIKVQIEALASGKVDRNVYRWIEIWKARASQLYEKAEVMFKGDVIANNAYSDILSCEKKITRLLKIKVIIAAVIVCIFFAFFVSHRYKVAARNEERAEAKLAEQKKQEEEEERKANATFIWPTSGVALHIPEPPSYKGEITFDDDEKFWFEVRGVDQDQYNAYKSKCVEQGYTIEAESTAIGYEAYNEEGYNIRLNYFDFSAEMYVYVSAPMPMDEIQWPTSEIVKRLPVPKSSVGKINWERASGFCIYLGNTSKSDFKDYANSCYEIGFTVDYEKSDTYFRAHDEDGYYVSVEYEGNNIMYIRIDEPDD